VNWWRRSLRHVRWPHTTCFVVARHADSHARAAMTRASTPVCNVG